MTQDEERAREKRLWNLEAVFNQHLKPLIDYETPKKVARDAETDRLREKARAAGKTEKEIRHIHADKAPGLYWDKTVDQYTASIHRFCKWLVDAHPEATKMDYIHRKHYDAEYLQLKYSNNVGSLKTNRSQLAKGFGCKGEDILIVDEKRPMPTKGRDFNPIHSPAVDAKKFGDVITDLTRITGARDVEVGNITPSCFIYKADGNMYCHFDGKEQETKGGRNRDALILPENIQRVNEIIAGLEPNKPIIEKVPSHFHGHAYRRLYAADIYHHFARPLESLIGKRMSIKAKRDLFRGTTRTTAPQIYHSTLRDQDYDRKALEKVVECLGHGGHRCDLAIKNYADYF